MIAVFIRLRALSLLVEPVAGVLSASVPYTLPYYSRRSRLGAAPTARLTSVMPPVPVPLHIPASSVSRLPTLEYLMDELASSQSVQNRQALPKQRLIAFLSKTLAGPFAPQLGSARPLGEF